MHASIDTTFWKRQTIGLETISGSQAGGVTTKGKNEGVFGDEGTVLCSVLVVLSQLYVFVKAHRAKIILFYVNKKIRKKKKKQITEISFPLLLSHYPKPPEVKNCSEMKGSVAGNTATSGTPGTESRSQTPKHKVLIPHAWVPSSLRRPAHPQAHSQATGLPFGAHFSEDPPLRDGPASLQNNPAKKMDTAGNRRLQHFLLLWVKYRGD